MLKETTMLAFDLCRWKIQGNIPPEIHKGVLVAAPHTSNYDLIFAMGAYSKLKIPVKFLIKKEWIEHFMMGPVLKRNGAISVNRDKKHNLVDKLVEILVNSTEDLFLMVEPEGTRKKNDIWKTGFYQIAQKANVPIILSFLDYKRKTAGIGPIFRPTGDYKKDMQILKEFYKDIQPKIPQNFSLLIHE